MAVIGFSITVWKVVGIVFSIPFSILIWFFIMVPIFEGPIIRLMHKFAKNPHKAILPFRWGIRFFYVFVLLAQLVWLITWLDLWGNNFILGGSIFAGTMGLLIATGMKSDIVLSFLSGFLLMLRGAFDVNDWITVTGEYGERATGRVIVIGMHGTQLRDEYNEEFTLDNVHMLKHVEHIRNHSRSIFQLIDFHLETDRGRADKVVEALSKRDQVKKLLLDGTAFTKYSEALGLPSVPTETKKMPTGPERDMRTRPRRWNRRRLRPPFAQKAVFITPKAWEKAIMPRIVHSKRKVIRADNRSWVVRCPVYNYIEEKEEIVQIIDNIVSGNKVAGPKRAPPSQTENPPEVTT